MRIAAQNQKGFSLIELLTVISLIAIITGIASLGFDFVRREHLSSATRELLGDMLKTRMDALTTGPTGTAKIRGAGIRFTLPNTYTTFVFDDKNDDFDYGAGEELNLNSRTISDLTFQFSSDPGYTVLLYDHLGVPKRYKPGDANPQEPWNDKFAILITSIAVSTTKCIKINVNSIREGMWNAGTSTCNEK